jgi:ribonuclease HII
MQLPTRELEYAVGGRVAQIDEVGRGALCGPVCAAAVVLPAEIPEDLRQIRDSKRVSAKKRVAMAARILDTCACGIGIASVGEINDSDIRQATFLAMTRALDALHIRPDAVLVDGDAVPPTITLPARAVIDGDALCTGIAAASIVAKVHRDALMHALAQTFPHYGWENNAGYGAAAHLAALQEHGHTVHHRLKFRGVRGTKAYREPLF